MSKQVKVLVLRAAGTNCNEELAYAFERCGGQVSQVHINALVSGEVKLEQFQILALPGGFSYGDDIASGKILANELRLKLGQNLKKFIAEGKLILGICNGFQVLVKAGILPRVDTRRDDQEATLFHNDSGKFEDRWTHLALTKNKCVWTQGLPTMVYFPVAHGEGKFIPKDAALQKTLNQNGQVVFRYCTRDGARPAYPDNPNGSTDDIAGICDTTGRVLGLMPHPERHFVFEQHPFWTRLSRTNEFGDGARIFENGISYARRNLLYEKSSDI